MPERAECHADRDSVVALCDQVFDHLAPSGSPSPSPFPTFFQQNNVIAPPTNADYLYVN